MNEISCLIFDDQADDAERIAYCLSENWRAIRLENNHVPELKCSTVNDENTARKILGTPGHGIHLLLCDVLIPDREGKSQMQGLLLIRLAKSAPSVAVAVAISKGPDERQIGDFYGKIADSGADLFFEKGPFQSKAGFAMTEQIVQLLEARGLLRYRGTLHKEINSEKSPALESAFECIGQSNLSAIASYFCFNSTAEQVFLSALKPGLSGADVLVARYASTTSDLSNKGVLLKISQQPDRLLQEFNLYQKEVATQQLFASRLIVDFLPMKQPFVVNGWGALGGRFEKTLPARQCHSTCTANHWANE